MVINLNFIKIEIMIKNKNISLNDGIEVIKSELITIPSKPGIYQMIGENEEYLYIGKAKNLKKRVASYFVKTIDNAKTRVLVSKICFVKHIVVDTETDALLLENNLIKKYQPLSEDWL